MQTELFNILKRTYEYKQFKSKSRIRSIVSLIVITAFWTIIVATTDFSNIDDVTIIYFVILILATFFCYDMHIEHFLNVQQLLYKEQ